MIFDVQFREAPIDHDQFRVISSLLMSFRICIFIAVGSNTVYQLWL